MNLDRKDKVDTSTKKMNLSRGLSHLLPIRISILKISNITPNKRRKIENSLVDLRQCYRYGNSSISNNSTKGLHMKSEIFAHNRISCFSRSRHIRYNKPRISAESMNASELKSIRDDFYNSYDYDYQTAIEAIDAEMNKYFEKKEMLIKRELMRKVNE